MRPVGGYIAAAAWGAVAALCLAAALTPEHRHDGSELRARTDSDGVIVIKLPQSQQVEVTPDGVLYWPYAGTDVAWMVRRGEHVEAAVGDGGGDSLPVVDVTAWCHDLHDAGHIDAVALADCGEMTGGGR